MMKVLMMLTWCTPKGNEKLEAGVFHFEQAKSLEQYCDIAMYYPYDEKIDAEMTVEKEWGLKTYRSSFRQGQTLYNTRMMNQAMKRIMKEFKPDIIHAHCAAGAGHKAVSYGKKYHVPVVITEHSPIELSGVNKMGISRLLAGKAYKGSKANICVSADSQKKLSAIYKNCQFDVIYNGIILPEYQKNQKKYYKDGYLNIVIVAMLYDLEIKGMKYLLQAMAKLKEKNQKIFLHHIGGGEYLTYFMQMAKKLEIEDICEFHGPCDRETLYEIVNEMDFFVSASLTECSGVSVQEAMLLGKAVLGTNSGGVDSLVPKKAGHIVEKANTDALVNGILYMKDNLAKFDSMQIKDYALHMFEIDHISRQYMELYQKVRKDF